MGNYCCHEIQNQTYEYAKKVSISSASTSVSKFNSVDSMKKHSSKLLSFLQQQNTSKLPLPVIAIEVVSQLGRGGQSKIFELLLHHEAKGTPQAKTRIAVKRTKIKGEVCYSEALELSKKILLENKCPFIIDCFFVVSCDRYMYTGMPVAQGGDLSTFLEKWRGKGNSFHKLGEHGIRLVIAGVILGLEYLHNLGYIYCDLKIDNVLICKNGYPVLADFQLVSNLEQIPRQNFLGTITYMGPEIHTKKYIDKGIDIWALGVLLYILAFHHCPFKSEEIENQNFVEKCVKRQGSYHINLNQNEEQTNHHVSKYLASLINSLLKVQPQKRLGYKSMAEIKNHQFFANFQWSKYERLEMENPIAQIVEKFPLKMPTRIRAMDNVNKFQIPGNQKLRIANRN